MVLLDPDYFADRARRLRMMPYVPAAGEPQTPAEVVASLIAGKPGAIVSTPTGLRYLHGEYAGHPRGYCGADLVSVSRRAGIDISEESCIIDILQAQDALPGRPEEWISTSAVDWSALHA